jgi:hypothetical protein
MWRDLKPANESPPCDRVITHNYSRNWEAYKVNVIGIAQSDLEMRLELEGPSRAQLALHLLSCCGFALEHESKAHPHFILKLGNYFPAPAAGRMAHAGMIGVVAFMVIVCSVRLVESPQA